MTDDRRPVAFDSNALTYFLDGNRGSYALAPNDPLAPQRIATVRLFHYCSPFIVPTVKQEAAEILNPDKLEEHMRFIASNFGEIDPDRHQRSQIEKRAEALLQHHKGFNDCRIVAELEWHGDAAASSRRLVSGPTAPWRGRSAAAARMESSDAGATEPERRPPTGARVHSDSQCRWRSGL